MTSSQPVYNQWRHQSIQKYRQTSEWQLQPDLEDKQHARRLPYHRYLASINSVCFRGSSCISMYHKRRILIDFHVHPNDALVFQCFNINIRSSFGYRSPIAVFILYIYLVWYEFILRQAIIEIVRCGNHEYSNCCINDSVTSLVSEFHWNILYISFFRHENRSV